MPLYHSGQKLPELFAFIFFKHTNPVVEPRKIGAKSLIKTIVVFFILDERQSTKKIEFILVGKNQSMTENRQEIDQLTNRYRHAISA